MRVRADRINFRRPGQRVGVTATTQYGRVKSERLVGDTQVPKYCLQCGQELVARTFGDVERPACPSCDFVHWGNFSLGVGALVVNDGKILLVRRAENPGKGVWTNPGGYVEQTEEIQTAIVREVYEETNVTATVSEVLAIRDQPGQVHNVYIAFVLDYVAGHPQPDGIEVDEAGFFGPTDLAAMNVANLTLWLIDAVSRKSASGLLMDTAPAVPMRSAGLFRAPIRGAEEPR